MSVNYEVEIDTAQKVKDLKAKIETLLGVKLINKLMIQRKQKRTQTNLNDEELRQYDCMINDIKYIFYIFVLLVAVLLGLRKQKFYF